MAQEMPVMAETVSFGTETAKDYAPYLMQLARNGVHTCSAEQAMSTAMNVYGKNEYRFMVAGYGNNVRALLPLMKPVHDVEGCKWEVMGWHERISGTQVHDCILKKSLMNHDGLRDIYYGVTLCPAREGEADATIIVRRIADYLKALLKENSGASPDMVCQTQQLIAESVKHGAELSQAAAYAKMIKAQHKEAKKNAKSAKKEARAAALLDASTEHAMDDS